HEDASMVIIDSSTTTASITSPLVADESFSNHYDLHLDDNSKLQQHHQQHSPSPSISISSTSSQSSTSYEAPCSPMQTSSDTDMDADHDDDEMQSRTSSSPCSTASTPPTPSLLPKDTNGSSTFISPVDESAITLLMMKESTNSASTSPSNPPPPAPATASPTDPISSTLDKVQMSPLAQIACHIILRLVAQRWRHGLSLSKQTETSTPTTATPTPTLPTLDTEPSLDTATPPTIHLHLTNLKRFAAIALRHSRPSTPHLLMHGLLLVHRIVSIQGPLPTPLSSPTRLLLAGLMLSEAHLSDTQTSASVWARVAGIQEGPNGIAAIKREALEALAYDVGAKEEEYAAWVKAVKKCFAKAPMQQQQQQQQQPCAEMQQPQSTYANYHYTQQQQQPQQPPSTLSSATSQTYIEAMEGATIAAARSTMEMILAVRRARALLAQAKQSATATPPQKHLLPPSPPPRNIKPRIQANLPPHMSIPTAISSRIGGARAREFPRATIKRHNISPTGSPSRRIRRSRNAGKPVAARIRMAESAQVPTGGAVNEEERGSSWMRTVLARQDSFESCDGMEVDGR
ncbi:hypothetical protein HDU97_008681, partial [Phlyctochytrium planicorne]